MMQGLFTSMKEIRERKMLYDDILSSGDYSKVKYCVFWLEQPPDIMCSGYTNPDWDFEGKRIQNLDDFSTQAQAIALSLVVSEERGCVFFSWLVEDNSVNIALVQSLLKLPYDQIPHAIVRFVLSSFENQFWRPEWWEGLKEANQDALIQRLTKCAHPVIQIPANYLTDDGQRVVDWKICRIDTNVKQLSEIVPR